MSTHIDEKDLTIDAENVDVEKSVSHYDMARPRNKSAAEKRLVLKQDVLIIPLLAMSYFFAYMDRGNIGNARLMGLQTALNINNTQYFQALMIFFVGYWFFEFPASLLLRKMQPRFLFAGGVLTFGLCATLMSQAKNFAGLMVLRTILGAGEAIVILSFIYLSLWYEPHELAFRSSLVYFSTPIAGFVNGLVAYGISKNLPIAHGIHSWQWMFIVEGIPTLALGLLIFFLLPGEPQKVAENGHIFFKSAEERSILLERYHASQNNSKPKIVSKQIWVGLKDPKTWLGAISLAAPCLGVTAFSLFLPTFIKEFGFSALDAQLYSIIPYAFAIVSTPTLSFLSDHVGRAIMMMFTMALSMTGIIMLLATTSNVARIAACCFVAAGAYPGVAIGAAWINNMHGGYTKRATAQWVGQLFIQCWSILGTETYTKPPRFFKGHGILLGIYSIALICTVILYFWLSKMNRERDAAAEQRRVEGTSDPLVVGKTYEDLYDYHPDWRYLV